MLCKLPLGCNNVPWETCELQIAGEQGRHYIWKEEKWQMEKENQLERDMRDRGRKGGQKKTWREGEKIANLRRKEMTERRKKRKNREAVMARCR